MAAPLEVTDEMRRAVYAADCATRGHVFTELSTMFALDTSQRYWVGGPSGRRAHITCQRCHSVWLLAQEDGEEGADYTDAETKFAGKLKNAQDAKPKTKPSKPAAPVQATDEPAKKDPEPHAGDEPAT